MQLLNGIRVLEMAVEPPANTATMFLADMGAEVIKVERPPRGDFTREVWSLDHEVRVSPYHLTLSRNKKSLTIDVRSDAGKEVFFALLRTCDALLQVSAPGTPRRLGIDYEACRAVKPDLVYVTLSGCGETGPYAHHPAHGVTVEALIGDAYPERLDDGRLTVTRPEHKPGVPVTGNGAFSAMALLAGLVHRNLTGEGSYMETSLVDAAVFWRYLDVFDHFNPYRSVYSQDAGAGSARYNFYECADGKFVMFGAVDQKFWDAFCELAERPDLTARADWGLLQDVGKGDVELERDLTELFKTKSQEAWMELLGDVIPIEPANTFDEFLDDDAYVAARQMTLSYEHPGFGPVTVAAGPIKRPGHPQSIVRPAPTLGEHNDELLAELGYDGAAIAGLKEAGVVF